MDRHEFKQHHLGKEVCELLPVPGREKFIFLEFGVEKGYIKGKAGGPSMGRRHQDCAVGLGVTDGKGICASGNAASLRAPSSASTPHALHPCPHLLQLQLDDLLLKGISFVLSLHVGLFNAVLLGTETAERVISQLQNGCQSP